jgi:predicted HicB family RNase H-like nuclease
MKTQPPIKRKPGRPATGQTPKRNFRISDDDWAVIEAAARSAGVSTSEWVRECLLKAARRNAKAN